ncbi:MAG TPA: nuclear transport factor 2 family protein [Opitutaceae bacterium]
MQQADITSEAIEAFRRYTQAFQARDARAVAAHFHEPAMLITPQGVVALPTAAAVEQTYRGVMADMPPNYERTEFSPLSGHRLSDDLVVVSGAAAWKSSANQDLMSFGLTYTLRRRGRDWRIVVAAIHAPEGGGGFSSGGTRS